ncbi:MAG TPA: penicillin acylase family protein [Polyangiaceae bacterium]|nr:penicillin acylase family protein [Polyangiaceae bacterium]
MNLYRRLFGLVFGERLAIVDGELAVPGVRGTVRIRRDRWGIPYIEAECEWDAWYGLGFCQGQDRGFQLEALLRIVRGTLAALAGRELLPMDRLSRRIGFRRIGEAQLARMSEPVRLELEAFASGITDGVRFGTRGLAHELALLLAEPTPFEAADVLGAAAFVAFALASNWDVELTRLQILHSDGPEAMAALESSYLDWMPVCAPPGALAGAAADRLAEDFARYRSVMAAASNNWAIAASRTKTGRPLFACDPHLPPVLPVHWYLAHLRTPSFAVCGACFIGQPGFSIGHTGFAAWGPTAGHHDNTDLFVERMSPDGLSVREGDRWVRCKVREEIIAVRAGADVRERVLETPRGPIVSPALEGEIGAVSLRSTWMAPRGFEASYRSFEMKSLEDLRRIHDPYPGTSLSFVYADEAGHIGWTLVGDAPVRKCGNGTVPLPGWAEEVGWEDHTVPMSDMPFASDPPQGFVASANNQPIVTQATPFLGVDWLDGYRQARIAEAIAARRDWDADAVQTLQLDQRTLVWRDVRDAVLAVPATSAAVEEALSLLRGWDGVASAASPAAAVFELFFAEMVRRAVEAKAPRAARWALGKGPNMIMPQTTLGPRRVAHMVALMRSAPPGWFRRSWPAEMADVLDGVITRLRRERGARWSSWAWGEVRPVTLKHFVSEIPGLARVFDLGPVPCGGDLATLAQGSVDFKNPTGNPIGIAALRMVVDVGRWDDTRIVLAGGQSGNPLSPHYDDLFALWQKGELARLAWTAEAVKKAAKVELRLEPRVVAKKRRIKVTVASPRTRDHSMQRLVSQ